MLQNCKKAIITFITKDISNEAETKELSVLLRCLSIFFALYYLVIAVIIASQSLYELSLVLIFAMGLLAGSFVLTYENKTLLALWVLNGTLVLISAFLSLIVGYSSNYHWVLFCTILIVFYEHTNSLKTKFYYSGFIASYMCAITAFAYKYPSFSAPNKSIQIFISYCNIFLLVLTITTISYFYRITFKTSEEKIMIYNKKLLQMASLDALTKLPNRRVINEHLQELAARAQRSSECFSIAIGDVDFFKKVNDTYGHDAGDYVLKTLATHFSTYMHKYGKVGRWGGEEFLFIFENMTARQAVYDLKKLCQQISEIDFHFKEYDFHITMTFGLEQYFDHAGIESTITKADSKLYEGKHKGRNQVVA